MRDTYPAIVAPVQPFRTNERVTSQQGLFLCSNSRFFGFELGLKQVLWSDRESQAQEGEPDGWNPDRLFKILVVPDARTEILRELHRMNINYATLFPGLDGFSRSLTTNITISKNYFLGSEDVDFRI